MSGERRGMPAVEEYPWMCTPAFRRPKEQGHKLLRATEMSLIEPQRTQAPDKPRNMTGIVTNVADVDRCYRFRIIGDRIIRPKKRMNA